MRRMLVVMCVVASAAYAQADRPGLVVVPLEVDPDATLQKHEAAFQSAFFDVVDRQSGATVASQPEAAAALTKTARQDFRESDESLSKFADKARSLYALHAWLQLGPKKTLILSGRVVRDDGKLMKSGSASSALGTKPADSLKALTEELLKQLDVGSYPTTREVAVAVAPPDKPVEVKPSPVVEPPPPLPPVDMTDHGAGQRTAGTALLILGGAVAVAGGLVAGVGAGSGFRVELVDGVAASSSDAQTLAAAQGAVTAGLICAGVGGLTAAVGAIVLGTAAAPPAKGVENISLAPVPGGAMVGFGGRF